MLKKDYHLHTVVSDGNMTPGEILDAAVRLGLTEISITDHDAVGAYHHFGADLVGQAAARGVTLIPGIELDSDYEGVEIHILGYGIDPRHPELRSYLQEIQDLRRSRFREQIVEINSHFGEGTIREEDIFLPHRDTLMGPHIVHTLLARKLFADYGEAKRWMGKNIRTKTSVPKPLAEDAVRLIGRAGGAAVLAHPGFPVKEQGKDLEAMIRHLLPAGLMGLETEYRYRGAGPHFPDVAAEREMVEIVRSMAKRFGLRETCGSDAHSLDVLEEYHAAHA